jgi:hypothetical protein
MHVSAVTSDRYEGHYTLIPLSEYPNSAAISCRAPALLPLFLHAGSPSLFIDACWLPFPYCCVHAPRPSLLGQHLPYCCALYNVLALSLVSFLTLKDSVYCCLALALGDHNLDASAIDLAHIYRDCLCHLWVQRGQAKLTQENGA